MIKPDEGDARGRGPGATPFREMLRLAELHPARSLLQVIDLLDRDVWHIEELTEDQRRTYHKVNALTALDRMRSSVDRFQAEFALDAAPRSRQWLATGRYIRVRDVLDSSTVKRLLSTCDHLLGAVGTPPIRLFDHPDVIAEAALRSIAAATLDALPEPLPPFSKPAILKKRTLLRRTFPSSCLPPGAGNANNQFWHQDSNAQFNDSPMLTLWIPLQDCSGVTRPGLQIIDAPVSYFSIAHGDSSPDLFPIVAKIFPKSQIVSIEAAAGDCIAFNGLTFHQTLATPAMIDHRDALLIRVVDERSAHLFPVSDPEAELLALG